MDGTPDGDGNGGSLPVSPDTAFQPIDPADPPAVSEEPIPTVATMPEAQTLEDACGGLQKESEPELEANAEPELEAIENQPAQTFESSPENSVTTKPIGPLYSPQMYPSIPEPAHMCDFVIQSQSSGEYKSCSAKTVLSAQHTRHSNDWAKVPSPPPEPKPKPVSNNPLLLKMVKFPPFFGLIHEANVTFCVDTSGSMYNVLDSVKEHLIEFLLQKASSEMPGTFNIVEFSKDVTQWSDRMVKCSPQTVAVAAKWIKKLEAKTSTNTQDALLAAFSDEDCDAVCLVTDGLPDQNPTDILDSVNYAADNRPVHAYYMQGDRPDQQSINFLQDLAMETYGSFHIVQVTDLGAIERITPIYRCDNSAERIIRSTNRNVYPSNYKSCRLAHTVDTPGPHVIAHPSPAIMYPPDVFYPFLHHPYYLYPWPYRHYFQYFSPTHGWSRYRPARAFLQQTQLLMDAANQKPILPGPGAFLIGQKVLARRDADGLFYLGTVKSQLMDNKFLVEFGPNKRGAFKATSYQETFVYNIVSYNDALRHAVLKDDKVLAPWEPEGERYGPGVVIQGQEKRVVQGGSSDQPILVTFYNGKTASVPANTAVWIPAMLHERISFEIQLPSDVRKDFLKQEGYPAENLPGYPTSGTVMDPPEYESYEPAWIPGSQPVEYQSAQKYYRYPMIMGHPAHPYYKFYRTRHSERNDEAAIMSEVSADDMDKLIPGTDYTKSTLNEKVMAQLMDDKMKLEELESRLKKQKSSEEGSLKKSVSFKDRKYDEEAYLSDCEAEYYSGDLEIRDRDSGRGSAEDVHLSDFEDGGKEKRDIGVGTHRLLRRSRGKSPLRGQNRPPWKYWNCDPAPDLIDPMHYGPYRVGPYEPWKEPLPIERRCIQRGEYGVEWTGPMSSVVDPFACHNYGLAVRDSLHVPKPPEYKPDKQGPGRDISDELGSHLLQEEARHKARTDFRRSHALEREQSVVVTRDEEFLNKSLMVDQHRERIMSQLERDRQRQLEQISKVEAAREAKKRINEELRARIEENQERERQKEEGRYDAMRRERERREEIVRQRQQEYEKLMAARQALKEQRANERNEAVQTRMAEQESQQAARDAQMRNAKLHRRQYYRQLETENQRSSVKTSSQAYLNQWRAQAPI